MKPHLLFTLVFIAGVGTGWLGNSWLSTTNQQFPSVQNTDNAPATAESISNNAYPESAFTSQSSRSGHFSITTQNATDDTRTGEQQNADPDNATDIFQQLLNDRLYADAINLYQEHEQQDTQAKAQLKKILIDRLELLIQNRGNSDFSELIGSYLSIYYDDIDVLFLLADFNQANSSYLEVIDVYLLADTYAYTDYDQQKVTDRFNDFVESIDHSYSGRENWSALINFYSHIDTSGLMTSTHRYQQALAHLRGGDKSFAIEQFNQLITDSRVGDSAAQALNKLAGNTETPAIINSAIPPKTEAIALQKQGNQYLVNLTTSEQNQVKLLIDTGASMTAISSHAFNLLNTDAVAQERRVFHTAGGVVIGTVYTLSELVLGPYSIKNAQVAVIDFDAGANIDGLLGMNILGQFRFQIDQENSQLLLSPD